MAEEFDALDCSKEVVEIMPESLAREMVIFPIEWTGKVFTIATASPLSDKNREYLESWSCRTIRQVIHPESRIREAIVCGYGEEDPESYLYMDFGTPDLDPTPPIEPER